MPFFSYLDRCTSPADQLVVTGDYADVLVLANRGFASAASPLVCGYSSVAHQASTIADMRSVPLCLLFSSTKEPFETRYKHR